MAKRPLPPMCAALALALIGAVVGGAASSVSTRPANAKSATLHITALTPPPRAHSRAPLRPSDWLTWSASAAAGWLLLLVMVAPGRDGHDRGRWWAGTLYLRGPPSLRFA